MKAIVIQEPGPVENMQLAELPQPQPAAGQVVVAVRAAALNHLDVWVRSSGRFDLAMPHVLGSDASGVIAAVGHGVEHLAEGDPVLVNPGLFCGRCEHCQAGRQSQCIGFGIVGAGTPGTFAQYVALPAGNVAPKPDSLSFQQAAALPIAYVTAWRMLITRAGLQAGQTVLIHGIGGGAALAGLQIAKLAGATAIVTSSSDDKLRRAAELGADHIVNYRQEADLAARVLELTGGRGVDVAFDAVGAATWPVDFAAVRRGGTIVLCGVTTGAVAETNLQTLYWNHLNVLGSTYGGPEELRQVLRAAAGGALPPVIDSVYPLEQAAEATRRMEAGLQFGKIVLTVGE